MTSDVAPTIDRFFFWLPNWATALIVIALACIIALSLHTLVLRLIWRSRAGKWSLVQLFLMRAANPTRFAIVLLALAVAIPISGIPGDTQQRLIAPLTSLFILLLGWSCIAAVGLGGDLYLDRLKSGYENALTRKHVTQVRLLRRSAQVMLFLLAIGIAMMTLPGVRQYGVSLFASAGAAGIVVGLAARPLLSNLLAGIQIALTQPVKIEDLVVINNEWGWVEDITSTYLVLRTWDWRRLIIPLSWFLEQPIQNWTRDTATIIGTVLFYVDYRAPIAELRQALDRLVHDSKLWDGNVVNLQVVDTTENALQIRILASASDASRSWDLRCELREKMIAFLKDTYPEYLPRRRFHLEQDDGDRPIAANWSTPREKPAAHNGRGQAAG